MRNIKLLMRGAAVAALLVATPSLAQSRIDRARTSVAEATAKVEAAQTAGAETAQILDEADARGIPTVAFTETLPGGQTYISWMQANIEALEAALTA